MSDTFDETAMSMLFDETTSPSQLDAALGQTYCEAFAPQPASKASPIKGRTMRDFEEKQAQLKKENFNLKLRIYFLEERMGQISGLKDKEEAIKNNIELKVENESMRKELSEKHELLCQAAKALDVLEEQRRKECGTLESRIQDLEKELQDCALTAQQQMKFSAMAQSTDSQYSSACFEVDQLTAQVQELQDQSKEDRAQISRLEIELENSRQQYNAQNELLCQLEETTGTKQADLCNRIHKLLDCEKLVSELQAQIKEQNEVMTERENRHAKVKANAINLTAKLNTVNIECQRLREEVKTLKKWKQDELRKPSSCPHCTATLADNNKLIEKLTEMTSEYNEMANDIKVKKKALENNAVMLHTIMTDLNRVTAECKTKDAKIDELNQKIKKQHAEQNRNAEKVPRDEDKECRLQSIQASLREKESQLVACEQRLEARDNRIQELELEIEALKKEYIVMSDNNSSFKSKTEVQETSCSDISHEGIVRQLADKDKEIENLNMELKKRTFNLQELVNKELWDKNKQIERLELRLAAQGAVCDSKELDLKEAKRKLAEFGVTVTSLSQLGAEVSTDDVSQLQEQLKLSLEEQKYLSREVDSLKERLRNTPERDSESMRLQRLLEENKRLQDTDGRNRLWRREASKALSVLRTRLEELAIFLDELLHQPALLVGLGADRQRVLRAAIDGSLELSKTIANLSSESIPDDSCSHMQCTGANDSLSIFYNEGGDSFNNVIESPLKTPDAGRCVKTDETLGSQKSQKCLSFQQDADTENKSAFIRPRRRSRSYPQGAAATNPKDGVLNPNTGSQSDSEAWSEPDRSVSQARMGIHNESSRTISSVASTVRRVSLGGQSSSSSCDSQNCRAKPTRRMSVKESATAEDHKLVTRTHCLEKLNQALENQLHIGVASSVPLPDNSNGENSANEVLSKANSTLAEKVVQQERHQKERQTEMLDMKFALVEMTENADEKQVLATQTMRGLEEKVQELSVQVLEVEVRREQAEQDAQHAVKERERLERDLGGKLAVAEREVEHAKREASALQMSVKQLLTKKYELEKEVKQWKEKAQEFEMEVEKWKKISQKCEMEVKEVHSQLSQKFKEKLFLLEQIKNAAEQRAEEWLSKFNEAEAKYVEIDCRAKEKICLMEEQLKLKQAEIERRSEELQEKLKREAEIRASRKLEKIVEQRMAEYDMENRAAVSKQISDTETALLSRISDLERKAAGAASEFERQVHDLKERHKLVVNELMEKLSKAESFNRGGGDIQRQLNDSAVATSQAQLETARLANEKLQLEQQVRWLQGETMKDRKQLHDQLTHKIMSLTQANTELQKHVKDLEREIHSNQSARRKGVISGHGSGSSEGKVLTEITNLKHCNTGVSDYVSEQEEHGYPENAHDCWYGQVPQSPPTVVLTTDGNTVSVVQGAGRIATASPDLGIESDQGRFSSLEPFPLKKSTTAPALNTADNVSVAFQLKGKQQLDYKGLEQENQELKQRLQHTRQTLEQTYAQLAAANQRKRLVEKAICKQLHKTHHILRRARDNFETNSSASPQPEESLQ